MSILISYYFNYPGNLRETAKDINSLLGCSLSPYQGDSEDLFCRFLSMEFSLSEQDLENDEELDFESYKYELCFRTPVGDGDLRPMQISALAQIAYTLYCRAGIAGMLIYDCEILLAKYEKRYHSESETQEFYDIVSDEFVVFPEHFETLHKRLPERHFWK